MYDNIIDASSLSSCFCYEYHYTVQREIFAIFNSFQSPRVQYHPPIALHVKHWCVGVYPYFNFCVFLSAPSKNAKLCTFTKISRCTVYSFPFQK